MVMMSCRKKTAKSGYEDAKIKLQKQNGEGRVAVTVSVFLRYLYSWDTQHSLPLGVAARAKTILQSWQHTLSFEGYSLWASKISQRHIKYSILNIVIAHIVLL